MIELLMKLAVNVDYARGPYFADLTARLQAAFDALPPDQRMRLQRRLTSEQSTRLPMSRSSTAALEALAFALTPPTGMEGETPEAVALRQQLLGNRQAEGGKWNSGWGVRFFFLGALGVLHNCSHR